MPDLSKIRVPAGMARLEIDDPENCRIQKPVGRIRGWFAASKAMDIPETFVFRIGSVTLPHRMTPREDVEAAMPGYIISGFEIPYDLSPLLPYIRKNRLLIHLTMSDYDGSVLRFHVEEQALAICVASASEG